MKYKILALISKAISYTPTSGLRVFLYNNLLNYEIINTTIGFGTRIYCRSFTAANCRIGEHNSFVGPFSVTFQDNCVVGSHNVFSCDDFAAISDKFLYRREATFGPNCNVSHRHFFDIAGELIVGDATWLAGVGSQFWTHGPGIKQRSVLIGSNTYVGAATRFAPGSKVGDHSLVAMGAIVTKEFDEPNIVIGGQPATILKRGFNWKTWSSRSELDHKVIES